MEISQSCRLLAGNPCWRNPFLKNCTLWNGLLLENFLKNDSPCEVHNEAVCQGQYPVVETPSYVAPGGNCEEEGEAETKYYELIFKDPEGYRWTFGIHALETEEIKQLYTLLSLSEDPSVVGLLKVKEQKVLIATTMVHWCQCCTNQDWFQSISWFVDWKHKKWSARLVHPLIIPYGQCKSLMGLETNSRLLWPEWSHASAKCCCTECARTSVWTGVEDSRVECHSWCY